jgi:hypothetical protein
MLMVVKVKLVVQKLLDQGRKLREPESKCESRDITCTT